MNTNSFVSDATEADFQEKVLVRSQSIPVLVDFWAPWCEPCKTLGPILEQLANEYAGQFELVKVDVEQNPRIGAAMRVQSVPTVYLVKDGQPVDGFAGGQPESAIRALLERHVELPAGDPLVMAEAALLAGQLEGAAKYFRQVLEEQPQHEGACIGLARTAVLVGDFGAAAGWLEQVSEENGARQRLRTLLELSSFTGDVDALQSTLAGNQDDAQAWYGLAATRFLAGEFEGAIEAFLRTVSCDREYLDDGGRKTLLGIFELLGADEPRVVKGRRTLAGLLF